jgi:hypothetical protein
MKTLTHWQWLILSKGMARPKLQLGPTPFTPTQQVGLFYDFSLKGWLNEIGSGPALVNQTQQVWGKTSMLGRSAPFFLFRGARGARSARSLDHCFLAYGLLRFGEELSGGAFSLLIIKNLLETASAPWLMEVFFFHSRLAQLFKLSRARRPLSITSPGHP